MSDTLRSYLSGETSDSGPPCFWSYAREDDARIGGKLGDVSQDLGRFYEFETGRHLPIFRDVESIEWGPRWETRVANGLQDVMFLIPAVTPNFLKSEACRAEAIRFQAVCRARGVDGLILPIVFSGRHLLTEDSPDEVAQVIARTQYTPFDEVWFTNRTGELWMKIVREMVISLIRIESAAEEQLAKSLTRDALDLRSSDSLSIDDPSNSDRPERKPINVEDLENESVDHDPQLTELIVELENDFESVNVSLKTAFEKFDQISKILGRWADPDFRPKSAKAANQRFFTVAQELDLPGREFQRSTAETYNACLDVDTKLRRVQQITGEMAGAIARDAFSEAIARGFRSNVSGIQNTVSQLDELVPLVGDAER